MTLLDNRRRKTIPNFAWLTTAALVAAVVAGVALLEREETDAPPGCLFEPSAIQVYRARMETIYAADQGALLGALLPGAGSHMTERLDGEFLVRMEAFPQDGRNAILLASIHNAAFISGTGGPGDFSIGRPIALELTIDAHCSILDVRFMSADEDGDAGMARLMEGLLLMLDFYLPGTADAEWDRLHKDKTGTYRALYRAEHDNGGIHRIARARDRYVSVSQEMAGSGFSAHVLESDVEAVVEPGGFWFSEVRGVEDLSILKGGRAVLQNRVVFELQGADDPGLALRLASAEHESRVERAIAEETQMVAADSADSDTLDGTTPPSRAVAGVILDDFEQQLRAGEMTNAVDRLVDALREDPELSARLGERITSGGMNPRHSALAFLALSEAGTRSALVVIEGILADSSLPDQRRSQAAFALASVKPPSMAAASALAEQLDRASTSGSLTSQSALIALGQMAGRIRDPDDPTKTFVRSVIGAHLQMATTEPSLAAALSAAHNSGDAGLHAAVEMQLLNRSSRIRGLALEALGSMDSPSVRDTLLEHLRFEPDSGIQAAAIQSLGEVIERQGKSADEEATAEIAGLMGRTHDATLRQAAVKFLGAQDSSAAKQALLARVAVEKDPDVLRTLGRVLSGNELMLVQDRH